MPNKEKDFVEVWEVKGFFNGHFLGAKATTYSSKMIKEEFDLIRNIFAFVSCFTSVIRKSWYTNATWIICGNLNCSHLF